MFICFEYGWISPDNLTLVCGSCIMLGSSIGMSDMREDGELHLMLGCVSPPLLAVQGTRIYLCIQLLLCAVTDILALLFHFCLLRPPPPLQVSLLLLLRPFKLFVYEFNYWAEFSPSSLQECFNTEFNFDMWGHTRTHTHTYTSLLPIL